MPYQFLADAVLVLHLGVILFVIGGLLAIVAGNLRGWRWVNGLPFRLLHLAAIAVVVGQAWLGRLCPLTIVESWLRSRAGSPGYSGSFIEHWVQRIIFYEAPAWVFTAGYTAFGLLVVGAWWCFPPGRNERV
jgi:Protein of Unknown function (DUF2784)